MERHMEIIHTHTQEDLDLRLNKSTEYAPTKNIDEAIEVWKIYKMLQRMKNK